MRVLGGHEQQRVVPHALLLQLVHQLAQRIVKVVEHGLVRLASKVRDVVKGVEVVLWHLKGEMHAARRPVNEKGLERTGRGSC